MKPIITSLYHYIITSLHQYIRISLHHYIIILKRSPYPYLVAWLILNLLQACFSELWHDEANYWMFSRHLDWGFFDHPPATPVMIALGDSLIHDELGVRMFFIIANILTLWALWKMTVVKDNALFFTLIFSCALLHVGGWLAAPDIPLLLFTSLFFLFLQQYLQKDSWQTALLLGLSVAGMAYSKYHGAVPLIFALIANLSLLKRRSFWLIPALALILFLPHLYWQYLHDFPTFRYHLIDRNSESWEINFVSDYILGQLLVFGPLISFVLFWGAFRRKPQDAFEKTLQWTLIGILAFFFLQSFRGRTEANWTATAFIPLVVLAYRHLQALPALHKWIYRLGVVSVLLMLVFRIYMVYDFLPKGVNPRNEWHGYRVWANELGKEAGDKPVVYYNNYQMPAKYMFYSGKKAHSVNINTHIGNQFDLNVADEDYLQGKTVFSVCPPSDTVSGTKWVAGNMKPLFYKLIDNFQSYNRLKIKTLSEIPESVSAGDTLQISIRLYNPTDKAVTWNKPGDRAVILKAIFVKDDRIEKEIGILSAWPVNTLSPGGYLDLKVGIPVPEVSGLYRFRPGIAVEGLFIGRNANFAKIEVHDR